MVEKDGPTVMFCNNEFYLLGNVGSLEDSMFINRISFSMAAKYSPVDLLDRISIFMKWCAVSRDLFELVVELRPSMTVGGIAEHIKCKPNLTILWKRRLTIELQSYICWNTSYECSSILDTTSFANYSILWRPLCLLPLSILFQNWVIRKATTMTQSVMI